MTLGAGGTPLLHILARPDATPEAPGQAGLYHTAFLMPERADLARWLVHVARTQVPLTGFADHSVSEAVYLTDPEGNGVEVYSDRPQETWLWAGNTVTMGSKELDIDDIFLKTKTRTDRNEYTSVPAALRIGHIHLRVGGLETARAFYADALGLDVVAGSRRWIPGARGFSSSGFDVPTPGNCYRVITQCNKRSRKMTRQIN